MIDPHEVSPLHKLNGKRALSLWLHFVLTEGAPTASALQLLLRSRYFPQLPQSHTRYKSDTTEYIERSITCSHSHKSYNTKAHQNSNNYRHYDDILRVLRILLV